MPLQQTFNSQIVEENDCIRCVTDLQELTASNCLSLHRLFIVVAECGVIEISQISVIA